MLFFVAPFRKVYDKVDGERRYQSPKTLETWTLKPGCVKIKFTRANRVNCHNSETHTSWVITDGES